MSDPGSGDRRSSGSGGRSAPLPDTIDHYRIIRRIGRGGQGDVYLAHDPNLDIDVAIKVLLAESNREEFVERFKTEARTSVRLTAPNIVRVFSFNPAYPYLVMEYCGAGDLNQLIKTRRPLPLSRSIGLIRSICEGLKVAHDHDPPILHRDLKPGNVLFNGLEPKVADFGLAKMMNAATSGLTTTRGMMGTVGYSSPEQLKDASSVDRRADLWSVGVMLYELLTFTRPFDKPGDDYVNVAIKVRLESPAAPPYEIPEPIWKVIDRALQKDPQQRFSTAQEMIDALNAAVEELGDSMELPLPPESCLDELDRLAIEASSLIEGGEVEAASTIVRKMRSASMEDSLPRYWDRHVRSLQEQDSPSTSGIGRDSAQHQQAQWLESRINSVRSLLGQREFREARRQIGELLIQDPDNSVVQQYIQRINDEETKLTTAINSAHDAAEQARRDDDFERLAAIWQELDRQFPDHGDIRAELAVAQRELKSTQQRQMRDAVKVDADRLSGIDDLVGALAKWDAYLASHSDDAEAATERRGLQHQLQERKRVENLERAEVQAQTLIDAGDREGALGVWERCLATDPGAEKAFARIEALRKEIHEQQAVDARESTRTAANERVAAKDLEGAIEVWSRLLATHSGDDEALAAVEKLRSELQQRERSLAGGALAARRVELSGRLQSGHYASLPEAESALSASLEAAAGILDDPAGDLEAALSDLIDARSTADRKLAQALAAARARLLRRLEEARSITDDRNAKAADGNAATLELERAVRRAAGILSSVPEAESGRDPLAMVEESLTRLDAAIEASSVARQQVLQKARDQAAASIESARSASLAAGTAGETWIRELDALVPRTSTRAGDELAAVHAAAQSVGIRARIHGLGAGARALAELATEERKAIATPEALRTPDLLERLQHAESLLEADDPGLGPTPDAILRARVELENSRAAVVQRLAIESSEADELWRRAETLLDDISKPDERLKTLGQRAKAAQTAGNRDVLMRAAAEIEPLALVATISAFWSEQADAIRQLEKVAQEAEGSLAAKTLKELRAALASGAVKGFEEVGRDVQRVARLHRGGKDRPVGDADSVPQLSARSRKFNAQIGNPALAAYDAAIARQAKGASGTEVMTQFRRLVDPPPASSRWWMIAAPLVSAALLIGAFFALRPAPDGPQSVSFLSLAGDRAVRQLLRDGSDAGIGRIGSITEAGLRLELAPGRYELITEDGARVPFRIPGSAAVFLPAIALDIESALADALDLDAQGAAQ